MTDSSLPALSDAQLLERHLEGDTEAFGLLFLRHRDRLWAVALRTLCDPEEAADALQEAMISAFRRAGDFRGDSAVTTWLHRIVVNASLDRLRRKAAHAASSVGDEGTLDLLASQGPAPATIDRDFDADAGAYEAVIDAVRQMTPCVVVDLPHLWSPWVKNTLLAADDIVIVAAPDLASLRNAKGIADMLKQARPNDTLYSSQKLTFGGGTGGVRLPPPGTHGRRHLRVSA